MKGMGELLLNKLITRRPAPERETRERQRENRGGWVEGEIFVSAWVGIK